MAQATPQKPARPTAEAPAIPEAVRAQGEPDPLPSTAPEQKDFERALAGAAAELEASRGLRFADFYDQREVLGRGGHAKVYRAVERGGGSGKAAEVAAKITAKDIKVRRGRAGSMLGRRSGAGRHSGVEPGDAAWEMPAVACARRSAACADHHTQAGGVLPLDAAPLSLKRKESLGGTL